MAIENQFVLKFIFHPSGKNKTGTVKHTHVIKESRRIKKNTRENAAATFQNAKTEHKKISSFFAIAIIAF